MRLRQKDVDEDEAEDADGSVEEERHERAQVGVELLESLGHHEPPQVGRDVGQGVGPSAGPDRQDLGGHDPREAPHAHVEGHREDDQDGQRQPPNVVHVRMRRRVVGSDVVENVEVDAHRNLGNGHSQLAHEQQDSPAHVLLQNESEDGGEEVGDADDERAVVGVDDRVGLFEDQRRVEGDRTLTVKK